MTEKEKREIAALKMDALRRSLKISRRDRIKNKVIKTKIKISETVEEEIQRKQLIWYGHVRKMEENKIPRMATQCKPTCKKKRRRPTRTWFDGIR